MRKLTLENKKIIEESVRNIIKAIGEDPDRPGLIETPKRISNMYDEVFEGIRYSNDEIAVKFDKCFEESAAEDLVCVGNIPTFSYCEHHLALMYNMKVSVAYLPQGKVLGLSKIARIVDMVTKRMQLQERIGEDIAYIMEKIIGNDNVMVYIEAEHSCMTARGIKKLGSITKSSVCHGKFRQDANLRSEVYNLIKE